MSETEVKAEKGAAITIPITGMSCAACAARAEKGLQSLPGVSSANVNLVMGKGTIRYDPEQVEPRQIVERVAELGFGVSVEQQEFLVSGMSCAACSARVESRLNALPGVQQASVNLAASKAVVRYIPGLITVSEIESTVRELGYDVRLARALTLDERAKERRQEKNRQLARFIVAAVFSLPLFLMMIFSHTGFHLELNPWLQLALATPVQLYAGWPFYRGAYSSLKTGSANMDVLVALGTSVAYFYSLISLLARWGHYYFESAAVLMTIILLGRLLEALARGRTSEAIERLMELQAKTARVLRQGVEMDIPAEEVAVGDLVVVRPGERVPVDGVIEEMCIRDRLPARRIDPAGRAIKMKPWRSCR